MSGALVNPVVHLELQTTNLSRACAFYTQLFDWQADTVHAAGGAYLALDLARDIRGGVIESEDEPALWLPYVEVASVEEATARARVLGAAVETEPREGPAGWRSVLAVPAGARIALWQSKG